MTGMTASDSLPAETPAPLPADDPVTDAVTDAALGTATAAAPRPAGSRTRLALDLGALADNWRALNDLSGAAEAAAVVKADGYGLGVGPVARTLHGAGAKTFFVAQATEGAELRAILGAGPTIYILSGFMPEDAEVFRGADLRPVINSPFQMAAYRAAAAGLGIAGKPKIGVHIESGINRLAFTPTEMDALIAAPPADLEIALVMSHLAVADEPENPYNARQLADFRERSARMAAIAPNAIRSLGATGGVLLGPDFHFDLTRPGCGMYGGLPFAQAKTVVHLSAPLLQVREIEAGESVGYGCTWTPDRRSRIGILGVGYADGLHRVTKGVTFYLDGRPAPLVGRVSMDMITLDLTDLPEPAPGAYVELLGPNVSVDALAEGSGTTGYEVLTGLGPRYARSYING